MTLKTYRAPSMAQALAEVKKDLGPQAVILHTRTYRVGGIAGIGARNIVEITASADQRVPVRRPAARPPIRQAVGAGSTQPAALAALADSPASPDPAGTIPPTDDLLRPPVREYARGGVRRARPPTVLQQRSARAQAPLPEPKGTVVRSPDLLDEPGTMSAGGAILGVGPTRVRPSEGIERLAVRAQLAPINEDASRTLHDELSAIKRLMGQVLQTTAREGRASGAGGMGDALGDLYLRLMEHQVAPELAERLCALTRGELSPAEIADARLAREGVLRHLASRIRVDRDAARFERRADGRPLTISLIGPTGVGKTTTLAKLAAICKLRHNRRVALITCDTYRIAAVEQLRTYANIIGLPIKVVMSPAEMASACESLMDFDVVLVDTPGRSQHDAERLDELSRLVDAARPHHKDLVLSAIADVGVLQRTVERFSALSPSRVILSKLDEGVHFGSLASVLDRLDIPISFVTTGQEVPDHIEPASPARLARLILDGRDAHA